METTDTVKAKLVGSKSYRTLQKGYLEGEEILMSRSEWDSLKDKKTDDQLTYMFEEVGNPRFIEPPVETIITRVGDPDDEDTGEIDTGTSEEGEEESPDGVDAFLAKLDTVEDPHAVNGVPLTSISGDAAVSAGTESPVADAPSPTGRKLTIGKGSKPSDAVQV